MEEFLWDGPEDPDEEIADLAKYKNQYERDLFDIKYSKNGLVDFIEGLLE